MSWFQRLSEWWAGGESEDTAPVDTPKPGDRKVHINTFAKGGDKFGVSAIVYVWKENWHDGKYDWQHDKMWDWSCHLKNLDETEAGALEYAQQYIENTKRNDHKVIHIKE